MKNGGSRRVVRQWQGENDWNKIYATSTIRIRTNHTSIAIIVTASSLETPATPTTSRGVLGCMRICVGVHTIPQVERVMKKGAQMHHTTHRTAILRREHGAHAPRGLGLVASARLLPMGAAGRSGGVEPRGRAWLCRCRCQKKHTQVLTGGTSCNMLGWPRSASPVTLDRLRFLWAFQAVRRSSSTGVHVWVGRSAVCW